MKHIIVVGGGISGLTAAYRLTLLSKSSGENIRVTLLESSERLGGKILTERIPLAPILSPVGKGESEGELILEGGPDSFITARPQALQLVRELGLESHLMATDRTNTDVFLFARGAMRRIPPGIFLMAPSRLMPFLRSDFMTWRGKLRMGLDILLPRGSPGDESMGSFARRRFGKEALELLVQPIMAGIYAGDADSLSLKSTFPRFIELEQRYRSVIRGIRATSGNVQKDGKGPTLFMTLTHGLAEMVEAMVSRIGPGVVRLGAVVSAIRRDEGRWRVELENAKGLDCDTMILAAPAWRAASLLQGEDRDLAALLDAIPFVSTATISLAYREPLMPAVPPGFGFVVAPGEVRTVSAGTFTSSKFPGRVPKGTMLLRCFLGGAGRESVLEMNDAELVRAVKEDLRRLLGIHEQPAMTRLFRWPRANPQYVVGHEQILSRIERLLSRYQGLWLAGASYRGVGIPDCIASGEGAAQDAFRALSD